MQTISFHRFKTVSQLGPDSDLARSRPGLIFYETNAWYVSSPSGVSTHSDNINNVCNTCSAQGQIMNFFLQVLISFVCVLFEILIR